MTAFIITLDLIDTGAKGIVGPSTASDKDIARLKAGEGVAFRLLDDDGEVYYHGRRLEDSDAGADYNMESELAPLDCFGTPNAGCTIQEERDSAGRWSPIN